MLRECWPGRPSGDESSVERPICIESSGVGDLPPLAAVNCCAITWSTEIPLLLLFVPLALTPVKAEAQLWPWEGSMWPPNGE
jgi:hypothetical protein